MKNAVSTLIAAIVLASSFTVPAAHAVGSHWVDGHYRSNGTYVESYRRTNPDGNCYNNYGGC